MAIIKQIIEDVNIDTDTEIELITDTGEVLKDIGRNGKEKQWAMHKQNNIKLSNFIMQHNQEHHILTDKRLEDLINCGNSLIFANLDDGTKRLKQANFCRNRICPMCQWRRSLKTFSQVSKITDQIIKEYKNNVRFLFLTLTIKNTFADELKPTLDLLNEKFKYLTSKSRTFAPMKEFKSKCWLGCMKAVEVTYNTRDNTFHPHIHCILAVTKDYFNNSKLYISQNQWRIIWQKALNIDYLPLVNIKAINFNAKLPSKAIAEMSKYPCKSLDIFKIKDENMAISVLKTFTDILYKRRFLSFSGIFKEIHRKLRLQDIEDSKIDLIHVDDDNKEKYNIVSYSLYKYKLIQGVYVN